MNKLHELVRLPFVERVSKGIRYTPQEIEAQPRLWIENFENLKKKREEIQAFLNANVFAKPNPRVILTGAGSSANIGLSVQNLLRRECQMDVETRLTTDIVTNWRTFFFRNVDAVLISFARSGNSPESTATIGIAEKFCPKICHVIVTCNKNGKLARLAKKKENALPILLSEEANDKGLAMTASFTTMLMTAQFLAHLKNLEQYELIINDLSKATGKLFDDCSDLLNEIADKRFERAIFLGSGCLYGCAVESSLKLQELTNGEVACAAETYLGVRHGPKVFINNKTLIVYFLSSDPFVRRYELDLMKEITNNKMGMTKLVVCGKASKEIKRHADHVLEFDKEGRFNIPDFHRPVMDVTIGQLIGLFKSLALGLKPDNPSEKGVISRVVKGVKIYN